MAGWLYVGVSAAILVGGILEGGWRLGAPGIVPDWGNIAMMPLLLLFWPLVLPLGLVGFPHGEPVIGGGLPVTFALLCAGLVVAVAWAGCGWYVLISACRRRL